MSSDLSHYPTLTQILLKNRGIVSRDKAEKFLNPDYERDIYDPFLILNMERAVKRICAAIKTKEKIVIWGDYDCDGIPGSVILHDFFKKIDYQNFKNYIPHRNNEGYGLNIDAIEELAKEGTSLLITVDCGITDVAEIARAKKLDIDVIVTDHHLPLLSQGRDPQQEILPPAYAILNSKQSGDTYPDKMLCGAGVAWKLVYALIEHGNKKWEIPDGYEKWLLDMVGLSTIADMVPLQHENRTLAYFGLKVIQKSRHPGLQKLLSKMGVPPANITEDDVGFMIGPRINAASRIGNPMDAFLLLSTTDEKEAETLATHLMHLNDTRKGLVASMVKEAKKHLEIRNADGLLREIIVIGNPSWKPGLVGLVAGSLSETYERTVFVWGRTEDGCIKGSCRSDGTVSVVELMTSVREGIFTNTGGHIDAGGFSVSSDAIHTLEDELVKAYQAVRREKEREKILMDAILSLNEVSWANWNQIEKFAPFGIGNPKPVFLFEKIQVARIRNFGKENAHLELSFENSSVKAISFFAAEKKYPKINEGDIFDLIATMERNTFGGKRELRLRIVDIIKKD